MKPCPNCKSTQTYVADRCNYVVCRNCHMTGPTAPDNEDETAERLWDALPRENNHSLALTNILEERIRQDQKWGEQNHDPYIYLTILVEEVGEFAQAALQTQFGGKHGGLDHLREEAVQTAAVALAIVECLDREKWRWAAAGRDAAEAIARYVIQNGRRAEFLGGADVVVPDKLIEDWLATLPVDGEK